MDSTSPWFDALKILAATESVKVETLGRDTLQDLVSRGLIRKEERPKQASLESRYDALQERHRGILEARSCVDRLQKRMAPKSLLSGLLPAGGPSRPGPLDPDVTELYGLLQTLGIEVRGLKGPEKVTASLDLILDYLLLEGRECLDRLADIDRELDLLQKQAPAGTLVEPEGFFALTSDGEAALPEAPVMEAFEAALQASFGTMALRGPSAAHFREDPGGLLAYLLEGMSRGERPSALISDYDNLLSAFERVGPFSEIRSVRAKIGLMVRLLRSTRDDPKRAYLWCNRERLNALTTRAKPFIPATLAGAGWHFAYATDLFLADGNLAGDEPQMDLRTRLLTAVLEVQRGELMEVRITDGQSLRLALALMHAARVRNFAPGILLDRFLRQAFEGINEAAQAAPFGLGDRGTRLLFGVHLACAAGWIKARLQPCVTAYLALQERLQPEAHGAHIHQAALHAYATLDRLERLGAPVDVETYLGIRARIRKRLNHHKILARALHTECALAGDEAALLSNLTARVCFAGVKVPEGAKHLPDVGLAGLYEIREPGLPPVLGTPFGSLMLP